MEEEDDVSEEELQRVRDFVSRIRQQRLRPPEPRPSSDR